MWTSCFEHLLISFISLTPCIVFTSIAPLLPLEIERRHLSSVYSGLIFCCYSLGRICSPCLSKLFVRKLGRLRSAHLMMILESLCILSFGLSKVISNNFLFISFSMLSRFFQGFFASLFSSFLLVMIPAYYEKYSTYMTAYYLGFQFSDVLGPVWGGLLYKYLGYVGVFVSLSLLCLLSSFLLLYFRDYEQKHPYSATKELHTLSYCRVLKVPGVFFGSLGFIIAFGFYVSVDPILPFKLSRQFGMDQHDIGLFFLQLTAVVVGVTILAFFVPHSANKVYFMITGYFILSAGVFMSGPSRLLGLPNSLSLMRVGMISGGVGSAFIESFATYYAMKNGEVRYPRSAEQLHLRVAVLMQSVNGFVLIIIPLAMALIYKAYSFQTALDAYGVFVALNAVAFLVHAALNNWNRDQVPKIPRNKTQGPSQEKEEEALINQSDDYI